jgi:hypothetical protein
MLKAAMPTTFERLSQPRWCRTLDENLAASRVQKGKTVAKPLRATSHF